MANNAEWIYNTEALRHLGANKELIEDFEHVADGEYIYIGNSTTARVIFACSLLFALLFPLSVFLSHRQA